MPLSALELRPRGPIALFDSGIRLCSRSSGLWALTLPGGALVTAAALHLFDAIGLRQDLLGPCALFTAAWFTRGVLQGAACHFLEQQLLGVSEFTPLGSLKTALGRLPSLVIAVSYLAVLSIAAPVLTAGLSFLLLGSQAVGYAVTMQGKGHPLALYGTCSKLLGPARSAAVWVRALFLIQALVILNVHVAANVAVYLGEKLLALDLTYANRFASLDNGAWVTATIAVGFALFEPLRAAVACLLLIDGRVRQEGLDLVAAIEQLPRRRDVSRRAARELPVLLVAALFAAAPSALARPLLSAPQVKARLDEVAARCGLSDPVARRQLEAVSQLSSKEQSALFRFLEEVEGASEEGDCQAAVARLERGLPLIEQTRDALSSERGSGDPRLRAARILARPEFAPEAGRAIAAEPALPEAPASWWSRFQEWLSGLLDRFWDWLVGLLKSKREPAATPGLAAGGAGGEALANVLVVVLVLAVLGVLLAVLLRARRREGNDEAEVETWPLGEGPQSNSLGALSRPPEGWAALADELAARGEFREAVRSLYLALLSRLHRVGAIDYDPARSNWDYFRGFKGRSDWVPPFRELTRLFDFTCYGNLGASLEGYRRFRTLTKPLLVEPGGDAQPPQASHA